MQLLLLLLASLFITTAYPSLTDVFLDSEMPTLNDYPAEEPFLVASHSPIDDIWTTKPEDWVGYPTENGYVLIQSLPRRWRTQMLL
jgi:hypothetical protein